jgi:iron complex outermembrane recepter protein
MTHSRSALRRPRSAVVGTVLLVAAFVAAAAGESAPETAVEASPAPDTRHPEHIDEIVVTAPLQRTTNQLAKPVAVMTEEEIRQRAAPQLGEVLGELPGVSQSYFGPGASRPVIRGLAGDNIRVLQNGLGLLDASSISPDHGVGVEPLLIQRAEVIRGPSALLYGPNAIGGVVNVTTRRLPDEPIDDPVRGAILGRGNSVNNEGAGVAYLEGGYRGFAIHASGFARKTDNVSIPGFARSAALREMAPLPPGETEEKDELVNTALENTGGGAGIAYHWDGGYFGVSPEIYTSEYGIPGAPATFIDLEQRRLDIGGAIEAPFSGIASITSRLGLVDYEHEELEATTRGTFVGTRFENSGYDLRIDVVHEPVVGVEGAFGFESFYSDFDATGAEAFFPPSKTAVQSLFAFEEMVLGPARLQAAGRLDISSADAADSPVFGAGDSRDFVTGGGSIGAVVTPIEAYSLALNLAYAQRPPNAAELYADGPHLATAQYEVGDRNLSPQESLGVEVVARKEAGRITGSLGGYYNEIDDFIDLIPTGEFFDTNELGHSHGGDPIIPVFRFENVPAVFVGTEAEVTVHAIEAATYDVHVNFQADWVFARNRDTREALPYLPPLRLGGEIVLHWQELSAETSLTWSRRQDNTPEFILPTDGYVMLNIGANYHIPTPIGDIDLFLRGTNLLDQEARLSTSTRKDFAPLPGAGVSGGALFRF